MVWYYLHAPSCRTHFTVIVLMNLGLRPAVEVAKHLV